MILAFGEYLPDLPDLENPGVTVATNVIPYATSYGPFPSPVAYTGALAGVARGFIAAKDSSGNVYNYAGDASDLYRLSDTTWAIATRGSGDYTTASTDQWEFAHWGGKVVATNYTDDVQVIDMGSSDFAALAGTPPRARHMAVVKDFLVLGNVTDFSTAAAVSNRVHWSGFDNIETYEPAAATQADYQTLQGEGGEIQRVVGGEYGIIFQQRSIWRMTYVGSPVVFQFDEVEPGRGTPAPGSVISLGHLIFYLGQDDFYAFNGASSTPIGNNKVYRTFVEDLDTAFYHKISATIVPAKQLVLWAYPGVGNTGGNPNKILVYSWALGRWALVEQDVELLCQFMAPGYTLDTLDSVSGSIDALTESLDSSVWTGGALSAACFDMAHKLNTLTGSAMDVTIETTERQLLPNNRALVNNIRPIVDGGAVTVEVGTRNVFTDTEIFGVAASVNSDGEVPVTAEGRYHRFRTKITGAFEHAQGLDVGAAPAGRY